MVSYGSLTEGQGRGTTMTINTRDPMLGTVGTLTLSERAALRVRIFCGAANALEGVSDDVLAEMRFDVWNVCFQTAITAGEQYVASIDEPLTKPVIKFVERLAREAAWDVVRELFPPR
jgi:hypothetical protein